MANATADWINLGEFRFNLSERVLTDLSGSHIALRPQSADVLYQLACRAGKIVARDVLIEAVWADVIVTDDSLIQCITDIRRAIGDKDRRIVQTVPKRGYRLVASQEQPYPAQKPQAKRHPHLRWAAAGLAIAMMIIGAWGFAANQRGLPDDATIAVLPFKDLTGDARWARLGRGLSVEIANELAQNDKVGVIGSDTAYSAAKLSALEAGRNLNAAFVLDGNIQADQDNVRISARLLEVSTTKVLWSEKWRRPFDDYIKIQDDIAVRARASLDAYFWFGALNRILAKNAKKKPRPTLSAYEAYLLGIENILWQKANYEKALTHFYQAVEIEPQYARAWAMIGVMKFWISDLSKSDAAQKLKAEARVAIRKAAAFEPHDAFIRFSMSMVHLSEGEVEAAQRAVFSAVEFSPNNPDILASAAWQSIFVGITGAQPLEWAKKAIDLNPKGPPWHKLGLGTAAFAVQDYEGTIVAMENAPPHHVKFVYLAASHMALGHSEKARAAAETLRATFPDYTLAGDMTFPINPNIERLMSYAEKAGIP